MKKVNLANVQESGEFSKLSAGGYVCKITNVTDVPLNPNTGKGDYLAIEYDIAEGEFKDYYKKMEENLHFWGGKYMRSYKEKALPMFKRMCSKVTKSNPGFLFDGGEQNSDERTLIGKYVGLVLGEEEYVGNDGSTKTRLYVVSEYDIADIRNGNFKVPEPKTLPKASNAPLDYNQFTAVEDGEAEIPFN